MKRPSHLVLDFEKSIDNNTNWSVNFVDTNCTSALVLQQVNLKKKNLFKNP